MATEAFYEVTIVGLQRDKRRVLDFLHTAGVVHLSSAEGNEDSALGSVPRISDALLTLRWMHEGLRITEDERIFSGRTLEEALARFGEVRSSIREQLQELLETISERSDSITALKERKAMLESIPFELPRGVRLPHQGPRSFALAVESAPPLYELLDERLTVEQEASYALITGPRSLYESTSRLLLENNVRIVSIEPLVSGRIEEIERIEQRIKEDETVLAQLESRRDSMREGNEETLRSLTRDLIVLRERYEKSASFSRTRSTFIANGFVPRSGLATLEKIAEHVRVDVTIEPAENAPVKLENNRYVSRFEFVTRMFGFPSNGSADPTPFIAFFVPLFFGFMFSDIGYGALLLGVSALLARKATLRTPVYSDAAFVLAVCAVSTIVFGFAFGSFFGTLISMQPLLIDPFTNAQHILIAALVLGLIHLSIGVILDARAKIKQGDVRSLVLTTLPFVLVQAAIITAALSFTSAAIVLISATVVLVLIRSKVMGLIELTGFFGTWFSYARLLALALATAGIALGVNIIAERASGIGWIGPVLFIGILIVGHLFNFALNVLGASIHSVRLHYIEFFSQFYTAGGEPYRPFETDEKRYTI